MYKRQVQIYEPGPHDPTVPPEGEPGDSQDTGDSLQPDLRQQTAVRIADRPERREKYYVDAVEVTILAERVQYLDRAGNLQTVSFRDFSRENLRAQFASLDDFLKRWSAAERKEAILEESRCV